VGAAPRWRRCDCESCGRTVNCIKTPDHCDEILRSRVESTEVIGRALKSVKAMPRVWVQMATAHRYGDPPEGVVIDEDSAFGIRTRADGRRGLGGCVRAIGAAGRASGRTRTSFVLGRSGGALATLARLARLGLGGRVGSGRQGMSWIHEHDMNDCSRARLQNDSMTGAYIATAPTPVSNEEFMRELRRAVGMPIGLPAFEWMVRIAAPLFLRTDPELALYGRYCVPKRLKEEGFEFSFPDLPGALRDLYRQARCNLTVHVISPVSEVQRVQWSRVLCSTTRMAHES
jgi:NAD dependent epimerase/dehydratase family enzyme